MQHDHMLVNMSCLKSGIFCHNIYIGLKFFVAHNSEYPVKISNNKCLAMCFLMVEYVGL
jgi:hypothetical protein